MKGPTVETPPTKTTRKAKSVGTATPSPAPRRTRATAPSQDWEPKRLLPKLEAPVETVADEPKRLLQDAAVAAPRPSAPVAAPVLAPTAAVEIPTFLTTPKERDDLASFARPVPAEVGAPRSLQTAPPAPPPAPTAPSVSALQPSAPVAPPVLQRTEAPAPVAAAPVLRIVASAPPPVQPTDVGDPATPSTITPEGDATAPRRPRRGLGRRLRAAGAEWGTVLAVALWRPLRALGPMGVGALVLLLGAGWGFTLNAERRAAGTVPSDAAAAPLSAQIQRLTPVPVTGPVAERASRTAQEYLVTRYTYDDSTEQMAWLAALDYLTPGARALELRRRAAGGPSAPPALLGTQRTVVLEDSRITYDSLQAVWQLRARGYAMARRVDSLRGPQVVPPQPVEFAVQLARCAAPPTDSLCVVSATPDPWAGPQTAAARSDDASATRPIRLAPARVYGPAPTTPASGVVIPPIPTPPPIQETAAATGRTGTNTAIREPAPASRASKTPTASRRRPTVPPPAADTGTVVPPMPTLLPIPPIPDVVGLPATRRPPGEQP